MATLNGRLGNAVIKATSRKSSISTKTMLSSITTLGDRIDPAITDPTRVYKVVDTTQKAVRNQKTHTVDQLSASIIGTRTVVFTGASTVGIGYNPQMPAPECKPVRKWPRDWHGDNIH